MDNIIIPSLKGFGQEVPGRDDVMGKVKPNHWLQQPSTFSVPNSNDGVDNVKGEQNNFEKELSATGLNGLFMLLGMLNTMEGNTTVSTSGLAKEEGTVLDGLYLLNRAGVGSKEGIKELLDGLSGVDIKKLKDILKEIVDNKVYPQSNGISEIDIGARDLDMILKAIVHAIQKRIQGRGRFLFEQYKNPIPVDGAGTDMMDISGELKDLTGHVQTPRLNPDINLSAALLANNTSEHSSKQHLDASNQGVPQGVVADKGINRISQGQNLSPVRAYTHNFADEVGNRLAVFIKNGIGRATINLDPPTLGSLKVDIYLKDRHVEVSIVTGNQMVKEMLQNNMAALKDALINHGLNLERIMVSVGDGFMQKRDNHAEHEPSLFNDHHMIDGGSGITAEESNTIWSKRYNNPMALLDIFA